MKDDAQINQGDINTLTNEGEYVVIRCGLPVEIRIEVTALEIELVMSDVITSEKARFALSG